MTGFILSRVFRRKTSGIHHSIWSWSQTISLKMGRILWSITECTEEQLNVTVKARRKTKEASEEGEVRWKRALPLPLGH
jgi:hypothetical protein